MHLNLAHALRREVFAAANEPSLRRSVDRDRQPPTIAVGLKPPRPGSRDYRVAVRVPALAGGASRSLLKRLARHERDFDIARGVIYRPRLIIRAGGSCGHERVTAGTLGGFVEDDDHCYILSNAHVLANLGDAARDDPILQPGPADIRRKKFNIIARLARWTTLKPGAGTSDAAIARLSDDADEFHPRWIPGIGERGQTPIVDRLALRRVVKRGRTTGVTRGAVSAFDLDGLEIDYSTEEDGSRSVRFNGQIEFVGLRRSQPFSKPGDSGAFILDERTLRPAALLFAGGRGGDGLDRTLGHFMPHVLREMRVRLAE